MQLNPVIVQEIFSMNAPSLAAKICAIPIELFISASKRPQMGLLPVCIAVYVYSLWLLNHPNLVSSQSSASRPARRAEAPAAVCGGGEEASLGRGQSSGMKRQILDV